MNNNEDYLILLKRIENLIKEGQNINGDKEKFDNWKVKLHHFFNDYCNYRVFQYRPIISIISEYDDTDYNKETNKHLKKLRTFKESIEEKIELSSMKKHNDKIDRCNYVKIILEGIFNNFNRFLIQTKANNRHSKRSDLISELSDEYDVQDLLYGILKLQFDDVISEEPVCSNGGNSSRIDFYLRNSGIFIEVKYAKENLNNKQIKDQYASDILNYFKDDRCKFLYYFIYDKDSNIENQNIFIKDLQEGRKENDIKIFISPKEN